MTTNFKAVYFPPSTTSRLVEACLLIGLFSAGGSLNANVVGPDGQNFNPVHGGGRFFTVEPSAVLGKGLLNLSIFADSAQNALPYYKSDTTSENTSGFKDSLTGLNMSLGVGVIDNLSMGLHAPVILSQSVKTDDARVDFKTTGLMEIRFDTKYRLWNNASHGIATELSLSQNQIKNNPFSGTGAGLTAILQLMYDWAMTEKFSVAFNVGFKKRQPGEKDPNFPIAPQESQMLGSMGLSYLVPSIGTNFIFEYFMSQPQKAKDSVVDRQNSSSELLFGAKISASKALEFGLGAGKEGANGMFSPDLRYFLGATYVLGPWWGQEKKAAAKKKRPPKKSTAEPEPQPQPESPTVPEPVPEVLEDTRIASAADGSSDTFQTTDIQFATDSTRKAYQGSQSFLNALGEHMKQRGFSRLTITGHTDNTGSDAYNMKLGQGRAQTIKEYLVNIFGHAASKITVISKGKREPIADNKTEEGKRRNRRVVFKLEY